MFPQRLCWLAALFASGCFGLEIGDGQVPCGSGGECPSGFRCVASRCSKSSIIVDADADVVADAPLADAAADAPVPMADARVDAAPPDAAPPDAALPDAAPPDAAPPDASPTVQLVLTVVGPGKAAVMPEGAGCGTGCFTFGRNATVLLTATPDAGFSFIGWTGGGCEASGPGQCVAVLSSDTTIVAHFCAAHVVVDAVTGDDMLAGTCVSPLKTIGKALAKAMPGQTVLVRPGSYKSPAEIFPLLVPDGIAVIGDEAKKGAGATPVRIEGGAAVNGSPGLRAAVVLGTGSVLAGFTVVHISSVSDAYGIVVTKPSGSADGAIIRNNTVTMSTKGGIFLERAGNAILVNNVVTAHLNGGTGIRITSDATGAVLEGNLVTGNTFGVEVNADADLGGGSGNSAGRNTFSCNEMFDVIATGSMADPITVRAHNNFWDHVPPRNSDLSHPDATVTFSGATQAPSFCP